MNSTRIGRAVTAQAMPMPSTACHCSPLGPRQPGHCSSSTAASAPSASGTPSARPAVIPVSRRLLHACERSRSIHAINTNSNTAHHAMRSEEQKYELQTLIPLTYTVLCVKKTKNQKDKYKNYKRIAI